MMFFTQWFNGLPNIKLPNWKYLSIGASLIIAFCLGYYFGQKHSTLDIKVNKQPTITTTEQTTLTMQAKQSEQDPDLKVNFQTDYTYDVNGYTGSLKPSVQEDYKLENNTMKLDQTTKVDLSEVVQKLTEVEVQKQVDKLNKEIQKGKRLKVGPDVLVITDLKDTEIGAGLRMIKEDTTGAIGYTTDKRFYFSGSKMF